MLVGEGWRMWMWIESLLGSYGGVGSGWEGGREEGSV